MAENENKAYDFRHNILGQNGLSMASGPLTMKSPLIGSGGSGEGGGGIFWIQTMPDDENSEARVLNKTYNEIKNAFDNGLLPIASVTALYPDDQYETTIMYFRAIGKKINNNVMHYIVEFVLESPTAGVMTFITTDPDSYLKSITDEEITA